MPQITPISSKTLGSSSPMTIRRLPDGTIEFEKPTASVAFTVTIAAPGVVTKAAHGRKTGDKIVLTTTDALPTGLAVETTYYVIYVSANTFRLATTPSNALAGTAITTSGAQSGTHGYVHTPAPTRFQVTNAPDFVKKLFDALSAVE